MRCSHANVCDCQRVTWKSPLKYAFAIMCEKRMRFDSETPSEIHYADQCVASYRKIDACRDSPPVNLYIERIPLAWLRVDSLPAARGRLMASGRWSAIQDPFGVTPDCGCPTVVAAVAGDWGRHTPTGRNSDGPVSRSGAHLELDHCERHRRHTRRRRNGRFASTCPMDETATASPDHTNGLTSTEARDIPVQAMHGGSAGLGAPYRTVRAWLVQPGKRVACGGASRNRGGGGALGRF